MQNESAWQRALQAAAEQLGVAVASIMAIDEVESRGAGFLADGRPVILFERHIMYRRLKKAGRNADDIARRYPALVNATPGGYKGGAQEWYRLTLARQIDADIADESASWGRYQIMGFHWQACGFTSIADFVAFMDESEARQLDAFVAFVKADPALNKALKAGKWAEVAKRYNGPDYKKNDYDTKLAAAYERHAVPPASEVA
ncbi:MAG: N-acetylmuramidase family protein [Georgfuchsia sp.]